MYGQPEVAFGQDLTKRFTVNVAQYEHEVGRRREFLYLFKDRAELVPTGAFAVSVDGGVGVGIDHKSE